MELSDVRAGVGVGSVFGGIFVGGFVFVADGADEDEEGVPSVFILGVGEFGMFLDEDEDEDDDDESESEFEESESSMLDSG